VVVAKFVGFTLFFLLKPTPDQISRFLVGASKQDFSYSEVGMSTRQEFPPYYKLDHNRKLLGKGIAVFETAIQAINDWQMFNFDWIELVHDASPNIGQVVCINARHLGFHSLNAAKVVYKIDERAGAEAPVGGTETVRYGFAYGTLADHVESGEERFSVEFNQADESVYYDLLALSTPGKLITRLAYPITRTFQKRFVRYSQAAMLRAVAAG
jgi:uncharacterized protein (UPF0548 family)